MSAYPPPSLTRARAELDASTAGYRVGCLEQLLAFVDALDFPFDPETAEAVEESRELVTQLREIFPDEWPDEGTAIE